MGCTKPDFGYGGMLADGDGVDMMMNYPQVSGDAEDLIVIVVFAISRGI